MVTKHLLALYLLLMNASCVIFGNPDVCNIYSRFSPYHTYCLQPNLSCRIKKEYSFIRKEDMENILDVHNKCRNKIAMGFETIGHLPPAADMLELQWDHELAAIAQKHADQCKMKHDCRECRQSENFETGQNLYMYSTPGTIPMPNWDRAIKSWYDEVEFFIRSLIPSFKKDESRGMIAHFTQVVWAKTWRVGCGYTVFMEGEYYKELYVCNYGPAGNTIDLPIYEIGKPCSACPINWGCVHTETNVKSYPGLCKPKGNPHSNYLDIVPQYKLSENNLLYYCNFRAPHNCEIESFQKQWEIKSTLSGSCVGIILKGGEETTLKIMETFKSEKPACFSIRYRKGPKIAGQEPANFATEILTIKNMHGYPDQVLKVPLTENDVHFFKYGMNLNFDHFHFTVSIRFFVPPHKPDQFFELKDISLIQGACS